MKIKAFFLHFKKVVIYPGIVNPNRLCSDLDPASESNRIRINLELDPGPT